MLINILTQLAADTGYHIVQQRPILLRLINRAVTEIYRKLETTSVYREVTLVVQPDSIVSLPTFVGKLIGMRMHTTELPFSLQSIGSPRYTDNTISYQLKNWRNLGKRAIHTLPAAIGQLTITGSVINPVTLLINGQTSNAAREEESIDFPGGTIVTSKLFGPDINKIACLDSRDFDITISDSLGNELATLYNNQLNTSYRIVDVSRIFWTIDTSDGQSLIDVCYKIPLIKFEKDTDSFAEDEFDEAIYHYAMHYHLKPIENMQDSANFELTEAMASLVSNKDGEEDSTNKRISWGRNKYMNLFRKRRYYPGAVTNVDQTNVNP